MTREPHESDLERLFDIEAKLAHQMLQAEALADPAMRDRILGPLAALRGVLEAVTRTAEADSARRRAGPGNGADG